MTERRAHTKKPEVDDKFKRRDMRAAAAELAMKDHHEREAHKHANMERLKAERLARSRSIESE